MHPAPVFASLPPAPLSRTSSATSFSSEDDASMSSSTAATVISSSRRTRKRFTNVQLTMLENLFHQNSHPSREDREAVAKAGGMEIKSVTIWFQNKRQTERKTAASNTGSGGANPNSNVVPNITSALHTFSLHSSSQSSSRTASPPYSATSSSTTTSRPSLDRVASRTELRVSSAPRTPSRRSTTGAIWDNMPSSPLAPPISPPARDFIDFGKNAARTRRTLEWACAAARLADKDGYASGLTTGFGGERGRSSVSIASVITTTTSTSVKSASTSGSTKGRSLRREKSSHSQVRVHDRDRAHRKRDSGSGSRGSSGRSSSERERDHHMSVDADMTDEEEDHEAITPPSTWGKDDRRWVSSTDGSYSTAHGMAQSQHSAAGHSQGQGLPKGVDDDDMFKAALALCGLGRR